VIYLDFASGGSGLVELLLNFEGADGSKTIIDESHNAFTKTAGTGATISTTRSKFGSSSLKITTHGADDIKFSGTAFRHDVGEPLAYEGWVYWASSQVFAGPMFFWHLMGGGNSTQVFNYINSSNFKLDNGGVGDLIGHKAYPGNEWVHFRVQQTANKNLWMRVNGQAFYTIAELGAGAGLAAGASGDMYVASQGSPQGGTCEIYLDNFRFMRGYEYADVDFDVPTAAHSLTIP
jgi:hypothetical protein